MTIQWQDFSSTFIDNIDDSLNLNFFCQIETNFRVIQVQLKTSDKSLKGFIIPKVYRNLRSILSQSNANSLSLHQDKGHAIELELGKTSPFGLFYNLSEYQLKVLYGYIDKNFANRFICLSKFSAGALVLFTLKPDSTL